MVYRCIVDSCCTTFSSRGRRCKPEGVRLHRFPKPQDRLNAWTQNIQKVNGPNWTLPNNDNTRICSLHFTPNSYELERQDGVVKLKPNSVPSIFRIPCAPTPNLRSRTCIPTSTTRSTTITSDHLYSVAKKQKRNREEAEKNSRRKVLENIMNSRTTDHVYASPYEHPICKIQGTQTLECGDTSSINDHLNSPPTPEDETNDDCEIIDLEDDTATSAEEMSQSSNNLEDTSQIQFKTHIINGLLHVELPDGTLAQLLTESAQPKKPARSCFTDAEVDKIQIKQLSEENRKLQTELATVRGLAEKLLRQNERLRQHNRVTARAYRDLKKLVERSNENLSKRLNEDQIRALSKSSTRGQKWSDETVQEAIALRAKCGTAVYKAISQRLPYPSIRKLQEVVHTQRFEIDNRDEDLLQLLASDIHSDIPTDMPSDVPSEESPRVTTSPEDTFVMNENIRTHNS